MFRRKTKVITYKGDRNMKTGIRIQARRGWVVENVSSRTKKFSLLTGFFTNKAIHTVTFSRSDA